MVKRSWQSLLFLTQGSIWYINPSRLLPFYQPFLNISIVLISISLINTRYIYIFFSSGIRLKGFILRERIRDGGEGYNPGGFLESYFESRFTSNGKANYISLFSPQGKEWYEKKYRRTKLKRE